MPSPDGLEIIRNRIGQRGLRGVFWWRVAASAVGAALVAASIVMVVPGLREQATPPPQGITEIGAETDAPEGESTSRPPNVRPPEVSSTGAAVPPTSARPSPAPTRTTPTAAATTPTPTPSRTRECPSPAPKAKDEASGTPDSCPTATPTPTATPSETATETSKDPTCDPQDCPSSEPAPTTPGEQPSADPTLSTTQEE